MPICTEVTDRFVRDGDVKRDAENDKRGRLRKVEVFIRSSDFELVRPALESLPFDIAITDVRTCGLDSTAKHVYRGAEYQSLIPGLKLEVVVAADQVCDLAKAFSSATHSETAEIALYDVGPVVRIPVPLVDGAECDHPRVRITSKARSL